MKKSKNTFMVKENRKFVVLALLTTVCMVIYLIWRALYTLPTVEEYGWIALIFGIALLIAEAVSALEAFVHCMDLTSKMEPEMPTIPDEWFPDIDVLIATHNEDEDILFKTANACKYMEYPDKSKVHVYLCDDGNREAVRKLAEVLKVGYFGMEKNTEAKAGNLNNALKQTNSPLVVTLDADMIPNSNFLLETVPYFFLPKMKKDDNGNWIPKEKDEIDENEKIGFIQTPQSFYNPDLFQYNLFSEGRVPNEQDYFFRQVNVGRNSANAPIYAGSNTVISREALEEVGGICTGTITEDFETGLLIEMKGYRCYAVNKLVAKGLAPTSVSSLIKQRERWGRGCIYSLRRHHIILNPKVPFKMKIAYMSCRTYWDSFFRRFIYILSPIAFILLGIPVVICGLKELLCIWLPTYILYALTLRMVSGNIRNTRISNIIDTIMFPYLMVPILAEVLCIHKKEFVVTDKSRKQGTNVDNILALPHIVLLILSVIALVISVRDAVIYQSYGSIVVIYWLLVNSGSLIMAIFFMNGRKNYRNSERFYGQLALQISVDGETYEATTSDFSEGGLSAILPKAVYIANGKLVDICIKDREYKAEMKMQIASVSEVKDKGYKYCFQIVEIDNENKQEYMEIIFDRDHSLPQTISKSSSVYGDIVSNIKGRVNKSTSSSRKLVRLDVNKEYPLKCGGNVFVKNFNFEYVLLEDKAGIPEKCEIELEKDVVLICHRQKGSLYKIDNLEALQSDIAFQNIIAKWDKYEEA